MRLGGKVVVRGGEAGGLVLMAARALRAMACSAALAAPKDNLEPGRRCPLKLEGKRVPLAETERELRWGTRTESSGNKLPEG